VLLKPDDSVIDVKYLDGPFRYLDNRWTFKSVEDEAYCDVEFFIDYEFKSRTLGLLMGTMFDLAFKKFSEAFEKRADQIYGL
jgi:coenzyme Q-binding protein COQ10